MRLYSIEDINWDALPHDVARAALARYLTGETADALAAEFGVSPYAVYAWLKRSYRQPRRSDAKPIPRDELRSMIAAGLSPSAIGRHFGYSETHVTNEANRMGLAPLRACQVELRRERRRQAKAEDETARRHAREAAREAKRDARRLRDASIVADYAAGENIYALSGHYLLDASGVWRVLQRAGVDTSRRTTRNGGPRAQPVPEAVA